MEQGPPVNPDQENLEQDNQGFYWTEEANNNQQPTHYVCIGASAGGLEAIESFFQSMDPNSGCGFIVVQHLAPQYKSLMVELLSKKTPMPVFRAENGKQVEPNKVYLIPPKKNLTIFHGRLVLTDQEPRNGLNLPIDVFLKSLAEDQGEKSIGIILSGTGSDGMRGVRAIKEAGGMVIVQEPDSAKFDGMPRSAIQTGLADTILPPEEMPEHLLSYIQHPYVTRASKPERLMTDEDNMARLMALLRDKTGVDFTYYKSSTIVRRIERRMSVNQIHELAEYVQYLENYPREILNLHRELLIGVTNFFRDPEAFEFLRKKVLGNVFKQAVNREVRIWVAGCSTGEEAYSLAILCRDYMDENNLSYDVKIFATDIDRNAIEHAGDGIYPESIAADIPDETLAKHFIKKGEYFQIARPIRGMVVFAQHNIVKDPPFTRINLLSCRNLLIYLQPILQRKAMALFQFSVLPDGILFLGTSETVGEFSECFESLHNKWKVYKAKHTGKLIDRELFHINRSPLPTDRRVTPFRHAQRPDETDGLLERLLALFSEEYVPLCLVVNEEMEVLHVLGETRDLLRVPSGKLQNSVLKMVPKDLEIPIATGLHKVFKSENKVRYTNIRLQSGLPHSLVDLTIRTMPSRKNQESLAVVIVQPIEASKENNPGDVQTYDLGKDAEQRIADLEQELQYNRENLQATIEELETSNEELQATNEELLASNEELQSTNEELQSVNEELYTVNAEYQAKIQELTELNNDMDNLLKNTQIATLFLDRNLVIRKFTPEIKVLFQLIDQDVGRPISHISNKLIMPDFDEVITNVQKDDCGCEREVELEDGRIYLMRAHPYHITPNLVSGVVVTFVEITQLRKVQQDRKAIHDDLLSERELLKNITETAKSAILVFTPEGKVTFCNSQAETMLGVSMDELMSTTYNAPRWIVTDCEGQTIPEDQLPFARVLKTGQPLHDVVLCVGTKDHPQSKLSINSAPILDSAGNIKLVIQTIINLDDTNTPNR